MNMMIVPDICPKCKEPTIGDGCVNDSCDWKFIPSELQNSSSNANPEISNSGGNGSQPLKAQSPLNQDLDHTTAPPRSSPPKASERGGSSAGLTPSSRSTMGNSRENFSALSMSESRLTSLEEKVSLLEGLVERPEQIKKYLLAELENRLYEQFQNQSHFITSEVKNASEEQIPIIQQDLMNFTADKITEKFDPAFSDKISDLDEFYEERLKLIIQEQLHIQLIDKNIDHKIDYAIEESLKKNFVEQFHSNLDELLLSKEDFVEIKTNFYTGHSIESNRWNPFARIWLWLSGTSLQLLSHCPESEVKKYQALGMTMLIPMMMAFLACFHLVRQHLPHHTFSNLSITVLISLLWAMVIMFIDRFLLVSYRNKIDIGGKWAQFGWRFFIALTFAVIFDASLLPTVFSRDVEKHLKQHNQNELENLERRFKNREDNLFGLDAAKRLNTQYQSNIAKITSIEDSLADLAHDIDTKVKEAEKAHERAKCEAEGGPGCEKGHGKFFKQAKEAEDRANKALGESQSKRNHLQDQLTNLRSENSRIITEKEQAKLGEDYQKLKVSAEKEQRLEYEAIMASSPSKENEIVFKLFLTAWKTGDWLSVAIFLAFVIGFILVDTFPIVMKFFMPRGRYDDLLDAQDNTNINSHDSNNQNSSDMSSGEPDLGNSDKNGNITTTLFDYTDLGLEVTTIRARFDPRKSHTAWPAIQRTLKTRLEPHIRKVLKPCANNSSTIPDYKFSSFCFRSGSPLTKL